MNPEKSPEENRVAVGPGLGTPDAAHDLCPRPNRGEEPTMPDRSDSTSDRLGRGLAAAFGPAPADRGVLETLADSIGPVPRVLLCDTDAGDAGPLVELASTELPDAP